jgi:hypothetical protein
VGLCGQDTAQVLRVPPETRPATPHDVALVVEISPFLALIIACAVVDQLHSEMLAHVLAFCCAMTHGFVTTSAYGMAGSIVVSKIVEGGSLDPNKFANAKAHAMSKAGQLNYPVNLNLLGCVRWVDGPRGRWWPLACPTYRASVRLVTLGRIYFCPTTRGDRDLYCSQRDGLVPPPQCQCSTSEYHRPL